MFFESYIKLPIEIRQIEEDGFHLMIYARINDMPALLLIDTGASRSVFDLNRMQEFIGELTPELHDKLSTGLGTTDMVTHTVRLKSLRLGELQLKDVEAVLLDLQHVNVSYEKLKLLPIDGVIGSDLLHQLEGIIDYGKMELKIKNKEIR